MTPTGAARSSDVAVVTGSTDYTDGTFQLQGTPVDLRTGLSGGIAFRYRDASDFYGCAVTSNSLQLVKRVAGTDTVLRTAAMTVSAGLPGWLRATATGSTLTCTAYAGTNGAPGTQIATLTATDATYPSGGIGMYSTNTTATAGKMMTFQKPQMTATSPASWGALAVTAGSPGEVPDRVATPSSGSASLAAVLRVGELRRARRSDRDRGSPSHGIHALGRDRDRQPLDRCAGSGGGDRIAQRHHHDPLEQPPELGMDAEHASRSPPRPRPPRSRSGCGWWAPGWRASTICRCRRRTGGDAVALDDRGRPRHRSARCHPRSRWSGQPPRPSVATATWTLAAYGSGPFGDGTGKTIPLADLAWRRSGTSTFTSFTTTAATIATGAATTAGVGRAARLPANHRLPRSGVHVAYSTTITYIATTP